MNCVWESSPVFDSCEFAGNHYALYSTRGAIPHITGCRIYRNVYGIVADFSSPLLLGNTITENRIGLFLERGSAALAAKNTIQNNQTDISSQESMGDNSSSLEMFKMWDMMRQLY